MSRKGIIRTDDVEYSARVGFNIGAIGVLAILAALYTLFWSDRLQVLRG